MANIFDIKSEIENCFDAETGEILDVEAFEALSMERDERIENVVMYYKDTLAKAKAIAEEITSLVKRKDSLENKADSLKNYIALVLESVPFETARCKVSFRPSESVVIDEDVEIPSEYVVTKETRTPNKKAIKEALKRGVEIAGCSIEKKMNLNIK